MEIILLIIAFALGVAFACCIRNVTNRANYVGTLNYQKQTNGSSLYWLEFRDENAQDKLDNCKYVILDVSEAR